MSAAFPLSEGWIDEPVSPIAPTNVQLSLTNICQQRCRFCFYDHDTAKNNPSYLPLDIVKRMHWLKYANEIMLLGNGEVLVHKDYPKIVSAIRKISPDAHIKIYTNGLALHGDNLVATIANVNEIHISQNAATQPTYDNVIKSGSFKRQMMNLELLSRLKPKDFKVTLSMIGCREAIGDALGLMDITASHGFNKFVLFNFVHIESSNMSIPKLSECYIEEYYALSSLKKYADRLNIQFNLSDNTTSEGPGICLAPFTHFLYHYLPNGNAHLRFCCHARHNIFVNSPEALCDLDRIWNNETAKHIRRTVNTRSLLYQNKMCLLCRLIPRRSKEEHVREVQDALGFNEKWSELHTPIYV